MKISIIGAGIGGLTTAIALQQLGHEVLLFDATPEIKPVGAGIVLAPNALYVLDSLGILPHISLVGEYLEEFVIQDSEGLPIQTLSSRRQLLRYGAGTMGFYRSDLHHALAMELQPNTLFLGKKCVRIAQDANSATAFFEDGSSTVADCILGADGIHSLIRKEILGEIPLRYSGQTCWRAIVKMELPNQKAYEIWGNENAQRFGFLPVKDDLLYFFAVEKSAAHQKDKEGNIVEVLKHKFAHFPPIVQQILANTEAEKVFRHDLFDLKPIKTWYKGRVALLGDAAHATTPNLGQGACQAIEDALALKNAFTNADTPEKAFEIYQNKRIQKAHRVVNTSWQMGALTNLNGWKAKARNSLLRLIPAKLSEKQSEWLMRVDN